jgi:hypothetical protein
MWVQRAGQNANTATINTKSNVATAISMTANWGESLVMNQLATNPATISAPRASQLNMIVSCYTGVFNNTLQSEAGYIDARPHIRQIEETSCNARPDHKLPPGCGRFNQYHGQ